MFSTTNSDLTQYINDQVLPKFEYEGHFEHWIGEPIRKKDQELRFFATQDGRFFALYNENFWGTFEEVQEVIKDHGFAFQEFVPVQPDHRIIKSDDDVVTFEQVADDASSEIETASDANIEDEFLEAIEELELVDEDGNHIDIEEDDFELSAADLAEDLYFRTMCAKYLYETPEGNLPDGVNTQYIVLAEVRPKLTVLKNKN